MASLRKRFLSKVDKKSGVFCKQTGTECWRWTASTNRGYGQMSSRSGASPYKATHVSWFLTHGEFPSLHVLHTCDNRWCVNPGHLWVGSDLDNRLDSVKKGRHAHGETTYAKLSTSQALEIIQRYRGGGVTQRQLSSEYGVGSDQISRIVSGKRWPHLQRAS